MEAIIKIYLNSSNFNEFSNNMFGMFSQPFSEDEIKSFWSACAKLDNLILTKF